MQTRMHAPGIPKSCPLVFTPTCNLEDARLEINKFHYFLGTQILIFLVHFINQYIWLNNKNENKCAKSENKKSKVRIIIKVKIISENN